MTNRTKIFLLFLGDIVALYVALFLTLIVRYGCGSSDNFIDTNLIPFSIIFIIWLIIFFIAGLYDLRRLRDNLDFVKTAVARDRNERYNFHRNLLRHPILRHHPKN